MRKMENNVVINNYCWVACWDLLGFKKEILRFEKQHGVGHLDSFVKVPYNDILDALQHGEKEWNGRVFACWGSDTFVFYTSDDSIQSFNAISAAAIHFCCRLLLHSIFTFRGALGTGQFYADKQNNVFLGSAFIDAYKYAEKQNWIGFVVTPSVENKVSGIKSAIKIQPNSFLYQYTKYNVPIKTQEAGEGKTEKLFAACIHRYNPLFRVNIVSNQCDAKNDKNYEIKYKVKYENTLKFINETI